MSEQKGEKQHENEHLQDMIDDISNLPDCILHHILSLIPTKEAVKTSILSTRWKNLWASVSNIDLDDALLYASEEHSWAPLKITSFTNFVEKVLQLRDSSNIEKFRLSCRVAFDSSQIHSWISYAIMHNVRNLDLSLLVEEPHVIPMSIYDSQFLVSLKIEMNCDINLPSHISFPNLKSLHLYLVTFPNDDLTEKLFSGCTVLEQLVLLDCEWVNLKNVKISSFTLKSLTIEDNDQSYFGPLDDASGCKINIDAANLTYLEYVGYLSNEIFLHNVSSLTKAYIDIPFNKRQKNVEYRVVELLKRLRYAASLRLSNRTMEVTFKLINGSNIEVAKWVGWNLGNRSKQSLIFVDNMVDRLHIFPNLSHLELSTEVKKHTFRALMDLLNFCPNLQSICLSQGFERRLCLSENDPIWSVIPICMSYHLKKVTFKNFSALDSEICFLKCVLKYACVLEKMDIWCCESGMQDLKKQRDVTKELEMINASSVVCVIRFLCDTEKIC